MGFARYFNVNVCRVRIVRKEESKFMRFLAACLWLTDKLGITNIGDFYGYVTTIGYTIYGPKGWDMDMPVNRTLLHELTHVTQHHIHGLKYSLLYLLSSNKRAYYESVCVQTEMMHSLTVCTPKAIEYRAQKLVKYGCKYERALSELKTRAIELEHQKPQRCSKEVINAYQQMNESAQHN